VIEETFPAPAERALKCLRSLAAGVDVEPNATGRAVVGVCGCGHPVAARTFEGAYNAIRDHFTRRVEQ
jgi:hypothetical protein